MILFYGKADRILGWPLARVVMLACWATNWSATRLARALTPLAFGLCCGVAYTDFPYALIWPIGELFFARLLITRQIPQWEGYRASIAQGVFPFAAVRYLRGVGRSRVVAAALMAINFVIIRPWLQLAFMQAVWTVWWTTDICMTTVDEPGRRKLADWWAAHKPVVALPKLTPIPVGV